LIKVSLTPLCASNWASKGLGSENELCTMTRNSGAAKDLPWTPKAAAAAKQTNERRFMAKPFKAPVLGALRPGVTLGLGHGPSRSLRWHDPDQVWGLSQPGQVQRCSLPDTPGEVANCKGRRCRGAQCPAMAAAWMAVRAMVNTMSSTSAPRDKSFTGLRKPCNMGPTDTTLAERCTAL